MYTTTSKQQEGFTSKYSHPKCFITTNSTAKLSRGAVNRGDVHVLRVSYKGQFDTTVKVAADWASDSAADCASDSTHFNRSKVHFVKHF